MRKQLLCGVSAIAVIVGVQATAFAADVPVKKAPPPAAAARLLDWSGFYVGGHLGYGEIKIDSDWTGGTGEALRPKNLSGIVGGMHAGRNWQVNTFVYGWEADLSATGWSSSVARVDSVVDPSDFASLHTKVSALASLRARLGMLFTPSLHGYVTGGLAYAHGEARAHTVSTVFEFSQQNRRFHAFGGVLGLGAEWKQTQNLSWRLEGLWYRLRDSKQFTIESTGRVKLDDAWVVRLGATYHFDATGVGKAPVVVPAGLPVKGIAPGAPLLTWTGPYVGGHLGYGQAKITGDWDGGADQDLTKNLSGIVGGMHAGQNWQVNTFVYGWEADLSATGLSKNVVKNEPGGAGDTIGSLTTKLTALASLRARLGMLFTPNLHGYVTGGLAYARGEAQVHAVSTEAGPLDVDGPQSQKFNRFGSVLGLGAEWKQTPNFSWRLEGLWYRLNDSKLFTAGNTGTVKLDDTWVVRLGATYHFDSSGWGKAPVVAARY